jgi:hypothetical protein
MRRHIFFCRDFRKNREAASPAISMVIITAVTVMLVVVSSVFALQALEHQQAASEFDTVERSVLAFDDALRDIAWDIGGSRSVRFTTQYGNMRLISSSKEFSITIPNVDPYEFNTSVIEYLTPSTYFTIGNDYYALGDERVVVSSLTDSFGQVLVKQEKGVISIALNYRVRISGEGPPTYVESTHSYINYVDIFVIRLNCSSLTIGKGDFDLVAKNLGLSTTTFGPTTVSPGDSISVVSEDFDNSFELEGGEYIFNLIIADIQVKL